MKAYRSPWTMSLGTRCAKCPYKQKKSGVHIELIFFEDYILNVCVCSIKKYLWKTAPLCKIAYVKPYMLSASVHFPIGQQDGGEWIVAPLLLCRHLFCLQWAWRSTWGTPWREVVEDQPTQLPAAPIHLSYQTTCRTHPSLIPNYLPHPSIFHTKLPVLSSYPLYPSKL